MRCPPARHGHLYGSTVHLVRGMNAEQRSPFALILRRLRLAAGLSQEQLAERARVSLDAVGALERGTRRAPYRETVDMLARAMSASEAERAELHARRAPAAKVAGHAFPGGADRAVRRAAAGSDPIAGPRCEH